MADGKGVVIIDAYNVINLMRFFRDNPRWDGPTRREKLCSMASMMAAHSGSRYIIVFDGFTSGENRGNWGADVSVVYSGGKSADAVIEKMAFSEESRFMTVVTCDNQVATICRNRGARVISVAEFEKRYVQVNEKIGASMMAEKGGKTGSFRDTLADSVNDATLKKLDRIAKAARAEAEKARERESAAEKKKKDAMTEREESELFLETMGGGDVRRVSTKLVDFGGSATEEKPKARASGAKKKAEKKDAPAADRADDGAAFDWTRHIDESFSRQGPRKK